MEDSVFIYSLDCPITLCPKYIGKANNIEERYKSHLKEKNGKSIKITWVKSLLSKNLRPLISIVDVIPEKEWEFWERHYISLYKSWGFELKNSTNGGDTHKIIGYQTRMRLANARKGKTYEEIYGVEKSKEIKEKLALNRVGGKRSPEIGIKISIALTGKKLSPAHINSLSKSKKGKRPVHLIGFKHSEESKRIMSIKGTGRPASEKSRLITSLRMKGCRHENLRKKIVQMDGEGNTIKVWSALREVEREMKITHGHIGLVLRGKRKTAKGFYWKYHENN